MKRLLVGALLLAGCGGGKDPVRPPELTTIQVTLSKTSLSSGETATATAAGFDASGAAMTISGLTWGSSANAIATVSNTGVVTGVGSGQAMIIASAAGKTGQAALSVSAWIPTVGNGLIATSLEGDPIPNRVGTVASPIFQVICSPSDNIFVIGATVPNIITRNGLVSYSGTNIPITSEEWLETSTFHSLVYPGTNVQQKTLTNKIATGTVFAIGFGEFNGGAQTMTFRVAGMNAATAPVFAACTGATIASPQQALALLEKGLIVRAESIAQSSLRR